MCLLSSCACLPSSFLLFPCLFSSRSADTERSPFYLLSPAVTERKSTPYPVLPTHSLSPAPAEEQHRPRGTHRMPPTSCGALRTPRPLSGHEAWRGLYRHGQGARCPPFPTTAPQAPTPCSRSVKADPWRFQQARCGAAGVLLNPILHKERAYIPTRALSHDKFAKPPVTTKPASFSRVLAFLLSVVYNERTETSTGRRKAKAALTRDRKEQPPAILDEF